MVTLAPPLDRGAQKLRRQAAGDAGKLRVVNLGVGAQRARQPLRQRVEAAGAEPPADLSAKRATAERSAAQRASCDRVPDGKGAPRLAIDSAMSSLRTGTAISAAAVGVGARLSEAKSISVMSVSWPTAEISGIMLFGRRAHHDLLVERPQIFERAAAARDDDQIGPRQRAASRQRVEAADGVGDFGGGRLALHPHRPHQDAARKAVGEAMQDVADDGAGRRRDDADHLRQKRQ